MKNFDKKEHIKSPEFYRNTAKKVVLGQDAIYSTIGTALRLELPERSELLIIGGGGGKELSSFHQYSKNWTFTILDPSEKMLKLAEYWSELEQLQERTKFLHGYLRDFEIDKSTFNAITSVAVFHYLDLQERLDILRNVKRLLKPNGVFIWNVGVKPKTEPEFQYLKKMFLQFPKQNGFEKEMLDKISSTLDNEYKMITKEEEFELIKKAGFTEPIEINSSLFFKTYIVKIKN
ncbi:MAG: class I SAM-dependent methyltransferase [Flavobacteriaceae bacterium]